MILNKLTEIMFLKLKILSGKIMFLNMILKKMLILQITSNR